METCNLVPNPYFRYNYRMNYLISEQAFFKYLKCPSWLSRERVHGEDVRDALMRTLQDEGLLREQELGLILDREYEEVELDDIEEAAVRTMELMKKGVQTIYKGVLLNGKYVARPDLLEKVEGKSKLGDWYYVAVDMKRSRHLKDEYRFQGAFYGELLMRVQGVKPVHGYVMRTDGIVESYLLEEMETEFHLTLESIESILDGHEESHFLTSSCKQSPWFSECEKDSHECQDLSLINRIWRSEIYALQDVGINTVEELADANMEKLKTAREVTMDRLYFLQQQAISLVEKRIIQVAPIEFPEPTKPVLVIDVETDPMRNLDYLFGVLLVEGEEETYYPFLAKNVEEEGEAWDAFVEFLSKYTNADIYHYGWYEQEVFRRMGEKYGVPDDVKAMFQYNMVDVLEYLRSKVIFPMPFYSLKDIAKHLGFSWRNAEASGLNSVLWYEDWLTKGDERALQDVVDYNEDDVRGTWFVRKWAVDKLKSLE